MDNFLFTLQETVRRRWDYNALTTYKRETFTYKELAEHIERFHLLFDAAGIGKGDKVAVCAKNSARWCIGFFAVTTQQSVVVPILADFHPDSVNTLVDHSDSSALFVDDDIWNKLDISKMPQLKVVISCVDFSLLWSADKKIEDAYGQLDELFNEKHPDGLSKDDISYDSDINELAIINYTSGTTSAPKGVMLSYSALSAVCEYAQHKFPIPNTFQVLSILPMAHMYGLVCEMLYAVCNGTEVVLLGKAPTPTLLMGAIRDIKPLLLITVPLVLEKIFKSAVLPKLSTPSMKVLLKIPGVSNIILGQVRKKLLAAFGGRLYQIVLGGAALNPDVEYWLMKMKFPVTVGYGMTEAAPLVAYEYPEKFVSKSCGVAIDCVKVRIDSEDQEKVVGEIQVTGPNIMMGYFKNEEATKAAFTEDGWLKTGDLGLIDKNGNIFIKGRIKNMLLSSNGQNIYPEEIEAELNNQTGVQESVVVDRGGRLVGLVYLDQAFLEANPAGSESYDSALKEIQSRVNRNMPAYSRLTKIEVVSEPFEKTPKMSIKRFLYS